MRDSFKKWLKKPWMNAAVIIVLLAVHYFSSDIERWLENNQPDNGPVTDSSAGSIGKLYRAYKEKRSHVWLTEGISFTVVKTLPDDRKGSAHQRFLVRHPNLPDTVLIAHNIDLAPYIPIQRDSQVTIAGRYEWNEKGGVIHWTHRDPKGRHSGGWIDFNGKRYQ